MLIVVVVAALALIASVLGNRFLRPRLVREDDAGMSVQEMVGPMQTLTILLLAFVLVTAAGSYTKADDAARAEAHALDHLAEVSAYAPAPQRIRLQSDVVCYARAVRAVEWPAMADGRRSSAPSVWSGDFRKVFQELRDQPVFGMLIAADDRRSTQRQERLAQSSPTIPAPIMWFLLCALTLTVLALGVSVPHRGNRGQLIALALITGLLTSALVIIQDVDRPFGGLINVPPTAIQVIEAETARDLAAPGAAAPVPCDGEGRRLAS